VDVLQSAALAPTLAEACADTTLMLGCSARSRGVALPQLSPRQAAMRMVTAAANEDVALVFGGERTGLTNDELARCHAAVLIPTDAEFSSLNLAAAVQVLCYELRLAAMEAASEAAATKAPRFGEDLPAALAELEGLFEHLERALTAIDFFKRRSPVTIMRRLRRLYLRAGLSRREVLILRGILSDAERMAALAAGASS
jgi:tRNA (cytidine32/uridine32-2'-O)-methyltransferase